MTSPLCTVRFTPFSTKAELPPPLKHPPVSTCKINYLSNYLFYLKLSFVKIIFYILLSNKFRANHKKYQNYFLNYFLGEHPKRSKNCFTTFYDSLENMFENEKKI